MSSLKISGFSTGTTALTSDKIPVERSGANVYITPAMIKNLNQVQCNYTATTFPTATDDSNAGYAVGSEWMNIDTAQIWICTDATVSGASWAMIDPSLPQRSGKLYPMFEGTHLTTVTTQVTDTIYLYPVKVYTKMSFTKFGSRIASAASGGTTGTEAIKWACWAADYTTAKPIGAPLAVDNTGVVYGAGTGYFTTASAFSTVTLSRGVYWFGSKQNCIASVKAAFFGISSTNYNIGAMYGVDSATNIGGMGVTFADNYANDMPTFTSGSTFTDNTTSGACPIIWTLAE